MNDNKYLASKPDEILDLVNEKDEVIGQVSRHEANADPTLIHREVGILVVDKKLRVLWQKRSQFKSVHPNMWSLTAGHVESGQEIEATAHRELEEELGFDTKLVFVDKLLKKYEHETHFMSYFLAKYEGQEINFPEAEIQAVRFLSESELKQLAESEEVNQSHWPVLQKLWSGEYDEQLDQLGVDRLG